MQNQVATIGTFVGGLNTEQPQLADQIQYTVDELNCQLLPDGTRARRYGIERETGSTGIPMTYSKKDWATDSKKFANYLATTTTTYVDEFSMRFIINATGAYGDSVNIITDGNSTTTRFSYEVLGTAENPKRYLCFYANNQIAFQIQLDDNISSFDINIKVDTDNANTLICTTYNTITSASIRSVSFNASDFTFSNTIKVLGGSFTTVGGGSVSLSNVCFKKLGEVVIKSDTESGETSFTVEYTRPGTYKVNITEAGVYTLWLSGAGGREGSVSDNTGTHTVQGSGGGALKAYVELQKGEYQVKVGMRGGTYKPADWPIYDTQAFGGWIVPICPTPADTYSGLQRGVVRSWTPAEESRIYRSGWIDITTFGGWSNGWSSAGHPYQQEYYGLQMQLSPYKTVGAYRGYITLTRIPSNFTVAKRTTNNAYLSKNSLFTNDTTGGGAINKNGYFKLVKGVIVDSDDSVITVANGMCNAYYWSNYNKGGEECIVVQQGSKLFFYNAKRPYDSNKLAELETISKIKDTNKFTKYSFSSGEGFLLVTSEFSEPFYVTLNGTTHTASLKDIAIQIRDLIGVNDSLSITQEPTTLSDSHKYNLLNQGWDTTKINSYYSSQSKYPSNALIWWLGKDSNGDFDAANLTKVYFGSTPAPKGHYILNYFNQDRASVSGISGIPAVTKNRYVIDTAFFAGRFFYLVSSTVLFSQVIKEDVSGIGKCYQSADPTSQNISDLIATDGGEIIFQELGYGKAIKKYPLGLLVFGSKAVYSIQSTLGGTFSATQYLTNFVTNAGAISAKGVVFAEDITYYWSPQGIYQITVDQVSGTQAIASSISSNTIQSWYNNLPNFSKENCIGAYDYTNRRIIWLFPTNANDLENRDGALVYYLDFNAFLPYKISTGGNLITVFETVIPTYLIPSIGLYAVEDEIVAGNDEVIVKNFGEEYGRNFSVCYLGYIESFDRLFFCDFSSREYIDWHANVYNSFLLSYPITFGSTWQKKYAPVLQCYFQRTEEGELTNGEYLAPSSCKIRARWKWANTQESNRWDLVQQGYIKLPRFMEFRYVNGKVRIKGSGPAIQLKMESEDDKDFKLSSINMLLRTE